MLSSLPVGKHHGCSWSSPASSRSPWCCAWSAGSWCPLSLPLFAVSVLLCFDAPAVVAEQMPVTIAAWRLGALSFLVLFPVLLLHCIRFGYMLSSVTNQPGKRMYNNLLQISGSSAVSIKTEAMRQLTGLPVRFHGDYQYNGSNYMLFIDPSTSASFAEDNETAFRYSVKLAKGVAKFRRI